MDEESKFSVDQYINIIEGAPTVQESNVNSPKTSVPPLNFDNIPSAQDIFKDFQIKKTPYQFNEKQKS